MDAMVLATQKWLNNHYKGVSDFDAFSEKELDGITGSGTFKRLIEALQIELNLQYAAGLTVDGDFGNGTYNALPSVISASDTFDNSKANNIVYIIQGSLWCKGYSAGELDGLYGNSVTSAVKSFQRDAGIKQDGKIRPYILKALMNTDGYAYSGDTYTREYELHVIQKAMNSLYGDQIGLTAPNGQWERKSQTNYIKCCQIEWKASVVDGIYGNGTLSKAPTLSRKTNGYEESKRLLQWGLTVAGYRPGNYDGDFDDNTYSAVYNFQGFMCLGADGIVGKNTWAALLSTRGNSARSATAFDTSTRLSANTASAMKSAGFTDVGRYLTNATTGTLDKKMTPEEILILQDAGLKVFPIYQTYGGAASYFTRQQGVLDATAASDAAEGLGFPANTCIYFAVDYDALMTDITDNIIPYFEGIKSRMGTSYVIGVYGPRAVCTALYKKGLTSYSFVADTSSGFTGNIGQVMPANWAYEQFATDDGGYAIPIDKCVASTRRTGISPDDFDKERIREIRIEMAYEAWQARVLNACGCYNPLLSLHVYDSDVPISSYDGVVLFYRFSQTVDLFNYSQSIAQFDIENGNIKYSVGNNTIYGLPTITAEIDLEVRTQLATITSGLITEVGDGKGKIAIRCLTPELIEISYIVTGELEVGEYGAFTYSFEIGIRVHPGQSAEPELANERSIAFVNAMNALTIVPKSIWYVNLAIVAVAVGVLTKQGDKHWGLLGITQFLTMVDDTDDME